MAPQKDTNWYPWSVMWLSLHIYVSMWFAGGLRPGVLGPGLKAKIFYFNHGLPSASNVKHNVFGVGTRPHEPFEPASYIINCTSTVRHWPDIWPQTESCVNFVQHFTFASPRPFERRLAHLAMRSLVQELAIGGGGGAANGIRLRRRWSARFGSLDLNIRFMTLSAGTLRQNI